MNTQEKPEDWIFNSLLLIFVVSISLVITCGFTPDSSLALSFGDKDYALFWGIPAIISSFTLMIIRIIMKLEFR